MRDMLAVLSGAYEYPVDIEFTGNFTPDNGLRSTFCSAAPCRPRGMGKLGGDSAPFRREECFFPHNGKFYGRNVRLPVGYVVFVRPRAYLALSEQNKYAVARQIGRINAALRGKNAMLIGPGRWGTTTPSLGVPVPFTRAVPYDRAVRAVVARSGDHPRADIRQPLFSGSCGVGHIFMRPSLTGRRG